MKRKLLLCTLLLATFAAAAGEVPQEGMTRRFEMDVRLTSDVPVREIVTLTDNVTQKITAFVPQP